MRQFIVNFLLQGQRNLSDFYSKCKQINLPAVLLFVQNERDVANLVAISVKSRWRSVNSQSGTLFCRTPNWWCVKKKRHYWPLLLEDSNVGESWIVQLIPINGRKSVLFAYRVWWLPTEGVQHMQYHTGMKRFE